jgi:hypothetical protein
VKILQPCPWSPPWVRSEVEAVFEPEYELGRAYCEDEEHWDGVDCPVYTVLLDAVESTAVLQQSHKLMCKWRAVLLRTRLLQTLVCSSAPTSLFLSALRCALSSSCYSQYTWSIPNMSPRFYQSNQSSLETHSIEVKIVQLDGRSQIASDLAFLCAFIHKGNVVW